MLIKPSASIRQNYNGIAALCKSTREPVYLTKNGEGDLVVMDIETFTRREKMLKLREELLAVEENHVRFLAQKIPLDSRKVKNDLMDAVRSLYQFPDRFYFYMLILSQPTNIIRCSS